MGMLKPHGNMGSIQKSPVQKSIQRTQLATFPKNCTSQGSKEGCTQTLAAKNGFNVPHALLVDNKTKYQKGELLDLCTLMCRTDASCKIGSFKKVCQSKKFFGFPKAVYLDQPH
jgi:hypothetical protein